MKYIKLFEDFLKEGVQNAIDPKVGTSYYMVNPETKKKERVKVTDIDEKTGVIEVAYSTGKKASAKAYDLSDKM